MNNHLLFSNMLFLKSKVSKITKFTFLIPLCLPTAVSANEKPNLLVIQTDEHTFRTLGCYRNLMSSEQADVWGAGNNVQTPNLDRLAKEGAICTNYYASSPVSTPSRSSFQTGLYPVAAGAPINGMPMFENKATFATILKDAGYQTDYVGKWHLAGVHHQDTVLMAPGFDFGYMDRTYQFESGHSKWVEVLKQPNTIKISNRAPKPGDNREYLTDYLTNRCLELLERDKAKPFCMMLSIPDPHSPDIAEEPYKAQYANMNVNTPATMQPKAVANRPLWGVGGKNESGDFDPQSVKEYFGMVKCVDDNVGKILKFLDDNMLTDNTIVVFTSDHGDMLFEHHRINKDLPYEASARIPFIIRYPNKIKAGKVIRKSYTTCDFAPTILGLMNAKQIVGVEGINDSKTFLNKKKVSISNRVIYMTDSPFNEWTAATDGRYKLVLSCKELPWLFDLKKDPSELVNYYSDPAYKKVVARLQPELIRQMKKYNDPSIALELPYLLNADAKITYTHPYDGKTPKEINQLEKVVLNAAIEQIQAKCFKTSK